MRFHNHLEQWLEQPSYEQQSCILKHRRQYAEIEADAPNLGWVLALMLDSDIELSNGEVVAAMKDRVLAEPDLTPLAWRFLANGNADHFHVVLDAQNPDDEPAWRWKLLVAWLQVLSGLHRAGWYQPLPEPIQMLFLHDGLVVFPEADELEFRGCWMRFTTLRSILTEAEKRIGLGTFDRFIEKDLPDVLIWLTNVDLEFDSNQYKAGWNVLAKQAAKWRQDLHWRTGARLKTWRSPFQRMCLGAYEIECIVDALTLSRHALSQRLCADRFLEECLQNEERILALRNGAGKVAATIRLSRAQSDWIVSDIRGFANSQVSEEIDRLGAQIARIYTQDWDHFDRGR